ncbi:DMT family transporter [Piscinibacter sp.]|uniref:DMT family transporter n=1 Tax=Piscinibacter sp. TaxID=1903157 RepID=UPI002C5F96DA|nr:DMT family transporter [Albitalea sp.]HUG23804.1 DMT family transporter [Albitalea sp.]
MTRLPSWQLFAICALVWGTTWHAILYQIGHTPPDVGVALRFAVAGLAALVLCRWRGLPLRFSLRDHGLFALQGVFMYGVAYVCVYEAERFLPSGLVAVGYSASPLLTGLGAQMLFGVQVSRRFVWGGVLGVAGVALIFWPEFGKASSGASVGLGALFTVAAVLLSAVGALAASRNRSRGLPFWPALAFGMLYGAAASAVMALVQGHSFALPLVASWWIALLYLALAGSVLTFACYLTLQDRLGPGPSGAVGVMTPLLALVVSMMFENYRPDVLTAIGAAMAVAGNVLMLRLPVRKPLAPKIAGSSPEC